MKKAALRIGIVAPSSKVPAVELRFGVEKLKKERFDVRVHPQCRKAESLFAGSDEERAQAFFEYASDPKFSVLWCARGGYGAVRILPILDRLVEKHGIPKKKLLAGYSDATALLEYVRVRWNWSAIHAPMPGLLEFGNLSVLEWSTLREWVQGRPNPVAPWEKKNLGLVGAPFKRDIQGDMIGGTLTLWTSLLGTPYALRAKGKIAFFEDTGEAVYKIDRMVQQLRLSGALSGAHAIVLGSFDNCEDVVTRVLRSASSKDLKPLRKKLNAARAILDIFDALGKELGIPVASGLPVGHGSALAALPLGAAYRLTQRGALSVEKWDWLEGK